MWRVRGLGLGEPRATLVHKLRVEDACGGYMWRVRGLGEPCATPVHGLRVEGAWPGQTPHHPCPWAASRGCVAWANPAPPLSVGCRWRMRVEDVWPGEPRATRPFCGPEHRLTPRLTRGSGWGTGGTHQPAGLRHSI